MSKLVLGTAAALAIALPALTLGSMAQTPSTTDRAVEKAVQSAADKAAKSPAPAASSVAIPKNTFYKGLGPTQYLVKSRLIGQPVLDKTGTKVGDIEDVILGTKDNQIDGVVMGVGGFLGVGEKRIGVRWSALKLDSKDGKTTITMPAATKELLAALEPYEGSKSMMQKAGEAVKGAAAKAGEVAKETAAKAGEMAKDAAAKAGAAAKSVTGTGDAAKK